MYLAEYHAEYHAQDLNKSGCACCTKHLRCLVSFVVADQHLSAKVIIIQLCAKLLTHFTV